MNVLIFSQDIGCAPDILTMNMTHTGELGYVFYIPTEFALHVYDELVEAGKVSYQTPILKVFLSTSLPRRHDTQHSWLAHL